MRLLPGVCANELSSVVRDARGRQPVRALPTVSSNELLSVLGDSGGVG
jgi:hypothetical protein